MKKVIFALFVICIMLLAGCKKQDSGSSTSDPFVGGTAGVVASFEPDAPPPEVYDKGNYPFGIVVKLKNEGEYEVAKENVKVAISGIFASSFNKQESDFTKMPSENLEAKKKDADGNVQESTPVYVEFNDLNHMAELTGNVQYTIRADVCYKYGTTANSRVCIRKNNLEVEEGVCKVTESKKSYSSGAPVQVTDFKETGRAKDKIAFTFTVEHKGNGQIYQQGTMCDTSSRNFEDRVWVEISTGLEGLECSGIKDGTASSGYAVLYSNVKQITCTQQVTTATDYEKTVVIKLTYDYKDSKETTVLVKHSLN